MLDPPSVPGSFKGALTIPQDGHSSRALSPHHAQRARAAHRVLEHLERDGIADLEVIERNALPADPRDENKSRAHSAAG